MSHSQTANQQGSGVTASAAQKGSAEGIRQVVAAQPTVAGSVTALLTAVSNVIEQALQKADPGALQGLADQISSDPGAWADAVLANTPSAVLTAGPFVNVPPHLQEAFTVHAKAQADKQAQTQGAAAPKH